MSLLLDALQRASKDKAASAGLATPTQTLKLDKAAHTAASFPDLTLSPAEPERLPEHLPEKPSPPLETTPTPAPPPEPTLELTLESAPRQPHPPQPDVAPAAPVAPAASITNEATAAASASVLPLATPGTQARQESQAQQEKSAKATQPTNRIAQQIRRAYAQPKAGVFVQHRRTLILGGSAIVLALAIGSLLLGLWGEPEKLLGLVSRPSSVIPVQPPPADVPTPQEAPEASASASMPAASAQPSTEPTASAVRLAAAPTPRAPARATPQTGISAAPKPVQNVPAPPGSTADKTVISSRTREPGALERAYSALQAGRLDDAEQAYAQALQSHPDERDALLGMAYISHHRGQLEAAQAYYRKVLRQEPGNAIAQSGLLALDASSDATLSAGRARELAARQPNSAAALSMLGNALVRDGLLADAAQAFGRAQALEPGNPLHAYNHAVARDRLGQLAQALLLYEQVERLAAKSAGPTPGFSSGFSLESVRIRIEQLQKTPESDQDAAP